MKPGRDRRLLFGMEDNWLVRLLGIALSIALTLSACTRSQKPEVGVRLTITRTIEEILPQPDTTVTFLITTTDGSRLFEETFEITFDGQDYVTVLDTVLLPEEEVEIVATIFPTDARCASTVDLSDGVAMSVSVGVRHTCYLEVLETEGWKTVDGSSVSRSELEEFFGGGHCGWQSVRFLALGGYFVGDAYVRDPEGVFEPQLFISSDARSRLGLDASTPAVAVELEPEDYLTLDLDFALPDDAQTLGFRRGLRELYGSPSDGGDYIYVVSPAGVERWPRVVPHPGCQ